MEKIREMLWLLRGGIFIMEWKRKKKRRIRMVEKRIKIKMSKIKSKNKLFKFNMKKYLSPRK